MNKFLRTQRGRLHVPPAVAHRVPAARRRADPLLALSELHQLRRRSPRPHWIGFENYDYMFGRDAALLESAAGHLHLRRPRGAGQADLRARRGHDARQGRPRHRHRTARSSTCPRSSAARSRSRSCGGSCSRTTASINTLLGVVGVDGPNWLADPRYSLRTLVVLGGVAVRLAHADLPRRPPRHSAGALRGRRDRRGRQGASGSSPSPCRCSRR